MVPINPDPPYNGVMRSVCADLVLQRLDRSPAGPRNRALYASLRGAILDGTLPPLSRLPASRDLAREIGLSRNTVTHAYDQLLAEGYVHSRVGSGTFVAATTPDRFLDSPRGEARGGLAGPAASLRHAGAGPASARPAADPPARLSRRARELVAHSAAAVQQWGAFMPGVPDVTQFPSRHFARALSRLWRAPSPQLLTYATGGGHPDLRAALAEHLRVARGVRCEPDQILITEGVHQAIDLTARMLTDPGDLAWVENPGYWGIQRVLRMDGLRVRGIAVDAQGMTLPARPGRPRLITVTPSHQYPLGSVMSLARRQASLAFARSVGAWVVEDDYDSEFRFGGHPIPAMQGLEADAPVIYIGTFSKTLFPGLRVGYMVLPAALADDFRTAHANLYREGHSLTQIALAELLSRGHYAAHIRRMRVLYGRRRALLAELIGRHLGAEFLDASDSNAGLHLVLRLPAQLDDVALVDALLARGILTRPLSRYYTGRTTARGLLLGYACVPEADIVAGFGTLLAELRARLG